jgi:hypothetical protein
MRRTAATLVFIGLVAVPLAAQGIGRGARSGAGAQRIPPGQLPPSGACRVWYDNLPPGRQPAPTNCREAERIASRDRNARVIYGANQGPSPYPGRYPNQDRFPYPDRYPTGRGGYGVQSVAFDNGYRDGYDKGREDARDNDSYDPVRHSRYRSADRGYDRRYGTREEYKFVYRDGFEAGYDVGYRETSVSSPNRRPSGIRWPWPF